MFWLRNKKKIFVTHSYLKACNQFPQIIYTIITIIQLLTYVEVDMECY